MAESRNYVIWGSAGHAKVLADLITLNHGCVAALIDRSSEVTSVARDVPLLIGTRGFSDWQDKRWDGGELFGLVAIGGALGRDRLEIQEFFRTRGVRVEPVVHPDASVCATALLGAGTQVLAQANVSSDARIGEACIINHNASVDHECHLGNGIHLAPGSTLCGCIEVGDNVLIGASAVVLPRVTIGEDAVVGAGAVVTRDVPAGGVVVGSPARAIEEVQD